MRNCIPLRCQFTVAQEMHKILVAVLQLAQRLPMQRDAQLAPSQPQVIARKFNLVAKQFLQRMLHHRPHQHPVARADGRFTRPLHHFSITGQLRLNNIRAGRQIRGHAQNILRADKRTDRPLRSRKFEYRLVNHSPALFVQHAPVHRLVVERLFQSPGCIHQQRLALRWCIQPDLLQGQCGIESHHRLPKPAHLRDCITLRSRTIGNQPV